MSKQSRKLSLKKETLRQLDDQALGQVAGGYYYSDMVMQRLPSRTWSGGCTPDTQFAVPLFDNYNFNYYLIR